MMDKCINSINMIDNVQVGYYNLELFNNNNNLKIGLSVVKKLKKSFIQLMEQALHINK